MPHQPSPAVVHHLLADLCHRLGFCSAARHAEQITAIASAADDYAAAFADAVLIAEGLNPETERRWRRQVRDHVEHYLAVRRT